jgi:hypothetical protein
MKHCPTCNNTYSDTTLAFCLTDGTPLVSDSVDTDDSSRTLASPTPPLQQYAPSQQWSQSPVRSGMNPKVMIGALIGLVLVAGIGVGIYLIVKSSGPSTPTATWKAFYAAAQKRDGAAMRKLMSKKLLDTIQKIAKSQPLDDFISTDTAGQVGERLTAETRNEIIDGNHATIEVKQASSDSWRKIPLVKEDGSWKLYPD